ncbi:hypothetical protein AXG93_1962s1210 [Marchantia polymorpha subsp. ruderalis]|uniref:Uncharacterized protein n=1 Tax=Marchantia polymorpha subsp. ruderalis TaxID=1480154 RepID=A0A176WEB8_MARPO|nr:hypothetical protein AXG93_1962s1210 [Marchantia polymorpha subsp. ruderalis]
MPAMERCLPSEQVPFDDSHSAQAPAAQERSREETLAQQTSGQAPSAQKPQEQVAAGEGTDEETRVPSAQAPSAVAVRAGAAGPPGASFPTPLEVLARHGVEAAVEEAARPSARELPRISMARDPRDRRRHAFGGGGNGVGASQSRRRVAKRLESFLSRSRDAIANLEAEVTEVLRRLGLRRRADEWTEEQLGSKRKATRNAQYYIALFRPESYSKHNETQDTSNQREYQALADDKKDSFFDRVVLVKSTLLSHFRLETAPRLFEIDVAIVDTIIGSMYFDVDDKFDSDEEADEVEAALCRDDCRRPDLTHSEV